MIAIPLRNTNQVALIDDEDFEKVNCYQWDLHAKGYAYCRFWNGTGYTTVYMHRLIMDAQPGVEVDHRNDIELDNQRHNLRLATHAQNLSRVRRSKKHTSQFRGVFLPVNRRRWTAQIMVRGHRRHLGMFENEIDAAQAYNHAAKLAFGEFARLNLL